MGREFLWGRFTFLRLDGESYVMIEKKYVELFRQIENVACGMISSSIVEEMLITV